MPTNVKQDFGSEKFSGLQSPCIYFQNLPTDFSSMRKPIPNIFLVGLMGAGKTTIGRRLAQVLNRDFIDSDQEIEQRAGASIPLIFEMEGEAGFRFREQTVIAELTQRPNIVLATGGGAVLSADNRRCLIAHGFVVYLAASVDELLRRTCLDNSRPLLQTADPKARLVQLMEQRDALYREVADCIISTEDQSVKQVITAILHHLENDGS